MANFVTISALSAKKPDFSALPQSFSAYEAELKKALLRQIEKTLPDSPDMIVFPEASSRYQGSHAENVRGEWKEFYKYLGSSIESFLKPVARNNNVTIAYSAVRYAVPDAEKPYRNSTVYIGRDGSIRGVYDKNYLVTVENEVGDVGYGDRAELIQLDFGKVASVICFDLNFDELLQRYAEQKPDLVVFSSMYHGGLKQAQWAYTCQSYFVGAVSGVKSTILNPLGEVIAESSNYTDHVSATVNLDCKLCHLDGNGQRFAAAKAKYKDVLTIHIPSYIGAALLTCSDPSLSVDDILCEFGIETLDEYFLRSAVHRKNHL